MVSATSFQVDLATSLPTIKHNKTVDVGLDIGLIGEANKLSSQSVDNLLTNADVSEGTTVVDEVTKDSSNGTLDITNDATVDADEIEEENEIFPMHQREKA